MHTSLKEHMDMQYYLDIQGEVLWNKVTLKEYSLNKDAIQLICMMKENPKHVSEEDQASILGALSNFGINIDDIEIFDDDSKCMQTPVVHIIRNCNSRCKICDCWKSDSQVYIEADRLVQFWREAKLAGAESVMVSGGEPLLHPQIDRIIQDIHEAGLVVELNTNGLRLERLSDDSARIIHALIVSIDGFTKADYAAIRGCNAFEHVCNNLRVFRAKETHVLLGTRVTLTKYALKNLGSIQKFANDMNLDVVSFSPLDCLSSSFSRVMSPERIHELETDFLPSLSELNSLLMDFKEHGHTYQIVQRAYGLGLFSWGPADFTDCLEYYVRVLNGAGANMASNSEPCNFPRSSIVVDYDGSIRPCFYGPGLVPVERFNAADWHPHSLMRLMDEMHSCENCRGKVFCDAS